MGIQRVNSNMCFQWCHIFIGYLFKKNISRFIVELIYLSDLDPFILDFIPEPKCKLVKFASVQNLSSACCLCYI